MQNLAQIEIVELRDSLAYSEFQLAKIMREREKLDKASATHTF